MAAFASALCKGALPKLRMLILPHNKIGPPGVTSLMHACAASRVLPELQRLDLSSNPIGDVGMALGQIFPKEMGKRNGHPTLYHLWRHPSW